MPLMTTFNHVYFFRSLLEHVSLQMAGLMHDATTITLMTFWITTLSIITVIKILMLSIICDSQHNDTPYNGFICNTQHNVFISNTQHNDTQHNGLICNTPHTRHNDTQHDELICDTYHNYTQHCGLIYKTEHNNT